MFPDPVMFSWAARSLVHSQWTNVCCAMLVSGTLETGGTASDGFGAGLA